LASLLDDIAICFMDKKWIKNGYINQEKNSWMIDAISG